MEKGYDFNAKYARFEPNEKRCAFCDNGQSEIMNRNYFAPLFKEGNRTNVIVYRSVKFQKLKIGVPRCNSCHKIHDQSKSVAWLLAIPLISIFPYLILTNIDLSVVSLLIATAIVIAGLVFLPDIFIKQYATWKKIKTEDQGAKEDKAVQVFMEDGWSLFQPTA